MKEEILQEEIVKLFKNNTFKKSIDNLEIISGVVSSDTDPSFMPHFSIDDLLRKKYCRTAAVVLESLDDCEIISGESIKNISLDKKEKLFPDVILFNKQTRQIIVIENKTSARTEREALTELTAYIHEIKNHLPFFSEYDISFIVIATEFNTLLDHSISSQVLSNINLLCLRPSFNGNQLSLSIHIPKSWTNIGQNRLPENALVGYTLTLKKKEKAFNDKAIIALANDLIISKANKYNSSGCLVLWKNGLKKAYKGGCDYGITIYMINSFAFLPNAVKLGLTANSNSILSKFIQEHVKNEGTLIHPKSLFRIADEASVLLEEYFDIYWERATDWNIDLEDDIYNLTRKPLEFSSWGLVGDYIRFFYFHPGVQNSYFHEMDNNNYGYLNPRIGLQIINFLTSRTTLFNGGHIYPSDLFKFGKLLSLYRYACQNATSELKSNTDSEEALLFWVILRLNQAFKELSYRAASLNNFEFDQVRFKFYHTSKSVESDYEQQLNSYVESFINTFLKDDIEVYRQIFRLGYQYGYCFNFLKETIDIGHQQEVALEIASISKKYLFYVCSGYKDNSMLIQKEVVDAISENYFDGELKNMSIESVKDKLTKNEDTLYYLNFELCLLKHMDRITGEVNQEMDLFLSSGIDWEGIRATLYTFFNEGRRYSVIGLEPNGEVNIGELLPHMRFGGGLKSPDEVYFQFYPTTGMPMVMKVPLEDVISGEVLRDKRNDPKKSS